MVTDAQYLPLAISAFAPLAVARFPVHAFERAVGQAVGIVANQNAIRELGLKRFGILPHKFSVEFLLRLAKLQKFGPALITFGNKDLVVGQEMGLAYRGVGVTVTKPGE